MNHQRMERHEEILGSEGTYIKRECNALVLFGAADGRGRMNPPRPGTEKRAGAFL